MNQNILNIKNIVEPRQSTCMLTVSHSFDRLFQSVLPYFPLLPKHFLSPSFPCPSQSSYKVSVEDPVCMEVMDAIQNLVEQRLDHSSRKLKWLLVGLGGSVELNNVLQEDNRIVSVVYMMIKMHWC